MSDKLYELRHRRQVKRVRMEPWLALPKRTEKWFRMAKEASAQRNAIEWRHNDTIDIDPEEMELDSMLFAQEMGKLRKLHTVATDDQDLEQMAKEEGIRESTIEIYLNHNWE